MLERILAWTSLPDLHPAVGHFPIALVSVGLLTDLAALVFHRRRWLAHQAVALWLLAALGAGAAVWSGERAEERAGVGETETVIALARHQQSAERTLWAVGIVAVFHVAVAIWSHLSGALFRPGLVVALLGGAVAQASILHAADLGGSLVYRHRVGVREPTREEVADWMKLLPPPRPAAPAAVAEPPALPAAAATAAPTPTPAAAATASPAPAATPVAEREPHAGD